MHLLLTIVLLCFAFWKGNWRDWKKYIHTIFYVIICNLLYNLLCHDYMLWQYKADFLPDSHLVVELFYSFINLPAVTLLFLTFYPFYGPILKQIAFLAVWVISSFAVEYPFYKFERLLLRNGYQLWMDLLFYIAMYSLIRLHFTRPLLTYGVSAVIISFMLWYFKVPLK